MASRLTFEFRTRDDAADFLESDCPLPMRLSHVVVDVEIASEEEAADARELATRFGGKEIRL